MGLFLGPVICTAKFVQIGAQVLAIIFSYTGLASSYGTVNEILHNTTGNGK